MLAVTNVKHSFHNINRISYICMILFFLFSLNNYLLNSNMSLVRVSTKATITPKAPSQSVDVQYPITWFDNHPGQKPILSITRVCPDLASARKALKKGIADNNINLDVAKTFLYYYAGTITYKLDDDWISYGRTIGVSGQEVTPLDLVESETELRIADVQESSTVVPDDDSWMVGYVLAIYHLIRATKVEYKAQIALRVTTQLKALKSTAPDISDIVDMHRGWVSDKGYNALIAIYDMYFNRIPLHPLANIRIGTTGSRFISYGYILGILGMSKTTDVMDWVFLEHIGNDIDPMMTSRDELLDTYFPYHVDLGLVTKSAFSATANPHFFEWVHVGMKAPRSLNARHISDSRALDILANAACVAYTYSHTFAFTKVYTEDGEEMTTHANEVGTVDDDGGEKSRNPASWCTLILSSDGEIPDKVKKFIVKSMSGVSDPREGTIEEHIKRLSLVFANK